jgi:hypothetical protein
MDGAVLLAGIDVGIRSLRKGHRLGTEDVVAIREAAAAGALREAIRLAWVGSHELHEAEAARILAAAAAGPGVDIGAVHQGRIDLVAARRGVLTISLAGLERINAIDPLELFTRWNHQPVEAGEVVASVKAAPQVVDRAAVLEGARLAGEHSPLVMVRPYAGVTVAAVVAEPLTPEGWERFESASRLRTASLEGVFLGTHGLAGSDPTAAARDTLEELAFHRGAGVLLVGGVPAGDPLAPVFAALETLGGVVYRRGVPAHPGSMLWLGRLGGTQLLGLPRCGAFGMATAADLLLPRLMTGEAFTAESIASLGHGGLLGREMRARFPAYASDLPGPTAS